MLHKWNIGACSVEYHVATFVSALVQSYCITVGRVRDVAITSCYFLQAVRHCRMTCHIGETKKFLPTQKLIFKLFTIDFAWMSAVVSPLFQQ